MTGSDGIGAGRGVLGRIASYLPIGGALAVILGVGLVAEHQSRELARQSERTAADFELETLRARLEAGIAEQVEVLSRLAGALAADPAMAQDRFAALAAAAVEDPSPIRVLAAAPAGGGAVLSAGPLRLGDTVARILAEARDAGAGMRSLTAADRPALLLWSPVTVGGPPDARRIWGHTAAVLDTQALFAAAGLRDAASGLDVVLTAAEPGARPGARAVHLGHAAVLADNPVRAIVAVPGGDWSLAARPKGGWSAPAGTGSWPIRLLTALSIGLVALPMLRTRRLVRERQTHIRHLHDREARLQEISQRLNLALDASRVAVWDYNIDRDELIWDVRMDELYGFPHDNGRRRVADWQQRLHPEDRARAEAEFRRAVRDRIRYNSEFRVLLEDGCVRHIRAIAAIYTTPEGQSKIVGVNWDVSAEVQRSAEIEARRAEAEAALAAKSQFLATMSHEIRTPMNGVIGMLDLLLRENLTGRQRDRAALVRDSARHLLAIVNDVLDFSKLEADRITLERLPVNVARKAGDVVALLAAANQNPLLRIFATVDGAVPEWIVGDPMRLRQILTNLVGNAVKFTDAGTVELRLGWDPAGDGILRVEVRDTGVGIPAEARERIFDRYQQADAAVARERGGTGLGLSICRQLVERMGGEIAVESAPGFGSTFRFWIPAPRTDRGEGVLFPREEDRPPVAAAVAGARILVAEDNPADRKVLAAYLEMAGHDVTFACHGADAVRALRSAAYDLVIMDVHMPVMDGLGATREIRALGGDAATLPIIALTGETLAAGRERCLEAGMTDHVEKPVSVDALFTAIERAMAAPLPAPRADSPRP